MGAGLLGVKEEIMGLTISIIIAQKGVMRIAVDDRERPMDAWEDRLIYK